MRSGRIDKHAAAVLAAVAVVGAVVAGFRTLPRLHGHARQSHLEALVAPARHEHLAAGPLLVELPRMRKGMSWWVAVAPGASVGLTNEGGVYRSYATYLFLPAVPASSARRAAVTVDLGAGR